MTIQQKTAEELSVLLSKTNSLAATDPSFAARLQTLVDDQEARKVRLERAEAFAQGLRERSADGSAMQLCKLVQRGELTYSPSEWVPCEFSALEDYGFVHCSYGATEFAGCRRWRTIFPTTKGIALAAELELLRKVTVPVEA